MDSEAALEKGTLLSEGSVGEEGGASKIIFRPVLKDGGLDSAPVRAAATAAGTGAPCAPFVCLSRATSSMIAFSALSFLFSCASSDSLLFNSAVSFLHTNGSEWRDYLGES